MDRINYRSKIAMNDEIKSPNYLIYLGGTHLFFHELSSFILYETIDKEEVQSESGTYIVSGRGKVKLPIDGDIIVEAYYTPHFSAKIISVGRLNETYKILFTCGPPYQEEHSTCIISGRQNKEVVLTFEIEDGLYSLKPNEREHKNFAQSSSNAIICVAFHYSEIGKHVHKNIDFDAAWHRRLEQRSPDSLFETSKLIESVPGFKIETIRNVFFQEFLTAKAKFAPI